MAVTSVACIGAGYVGGPTMAVLAMKCPDVMCTVLDVNIAQISRWNSNDLPVYEPGLQEIVLACRGRNLFFSTEVLQHVAQADVVFIAVNTPPKESGLGAGSACDLSYFEKAARMVAQALSSTTSNSHKIIVEKSTVPVRTAQFLSEIIQANTRPSVRFSILSNPEFLAEGSAIKDLLNPDRILIGGVDQESQERLKKLYERWVPAERIITTNLWSSELAKLCCNAMLAQRISSINSISALCEETGADVTEVARVIGSDSRIGPKYLNAGVGFGGSCLAKDCLSLVYICETLGLRDVAEYWRQVINMNNFQRRRFTERIVQEMHHCLSGKRIAVLGFAYKKNTADTRETSSAVVIRSLLSESAIVVVYDPKVKRSAMLSEMTRQHLLDDISIETQLLTAESAEEAIAGSGAVVVMTEWDEFASLDFPHLYERMEKPARIYDGKGILPAERLRTIGYEVYTIGQSKYRLV